MDDKRIVAVEFSDGEREYYGPFASIETSAEFVAAYIEWFDGLSGDRTITSIVDDGLTSPFRLAAAAERTARV